MLISEMTTFVFQFVGRERGAIDNNIESVRRIKAKTEGEAEGQLRRNFEISYIIQSYQV